MRADIAALVAAFCCAVVGAARGEAACQMQELGELPVNVEDNVTIDVQLNGRPVRLIVDTGSSETFITRPAADQLGLALQPVSGLELYGVGGKEKGMTAHIKELKVANLVARNYDILVIGGHNFGAAQGVLGARFLMQNDVEFDFAHGKLRFFKPKNCKGDQVVYWGSNYSVAPMSGLSDSKINVTVLLNGRSAKTTMDTGAGVSIVTTTGAAKVGVKSTPAGVTTTDTIDGLGRDKVKSYNAVFPSFAFGDETIRNARLRIADMFYADKVAAVASNDSAVVFDEIDMVLGADFFRSHRVYLSLSQRKVYVSYVGGPVFSAPDNAPPKAGDHGAGAAKP